MTKKPRITQQTLKILNIFMQDPKKEISGTDIRKQTKLMSGTVYPILLRLEKAQWLESEWEDIDAAMEGRPQKRLYKITNLGQQEACNAFKEISPSFSPSWGSHFA